MKRVIALFLVLALTFSLAACGQPNTNGGTNAQPSNTAASEQPSNTGKYKIAIYTSTVSQNEEEFRSMEVADKKYPGLIVSQTYPDAFTKEQETVISNAVALVSDPEVKVLIMNQAVPGACAAFEKVREVRPDVLICAYQPAETDIIASKADIAVIADDARMGYEIPKQAAKLGAKTFVHYSFPRHMSYPLLALRRDTFKIECEKLGIKFVDATAPDPTGDAGLPGAQQFITEDVPRKVAEYGKDTNFFSTNCGMQEPLIKTAMAEGAICAQQCCPSPFHGYPGALGIAAEGDKKLDANYIIEQITGKLKDAGVSGRFSTWPFSATMLGTAAMVEYGKMYAEGKLKDKNDPEALKKCFAEVSNNAKLEFSNYVAKDKDGKETEQKNFYLMWADYITF